MRSVRSARSARSTSSALQSAHTPASAGLSRVEVSRGRQMFLPHKRHSRKAHEHDDKYVLDEQVELKKKRYRAREERMKKEAEEELAEWKVAVEAEAKKQIDLRMRRGHGRRTSWALTVCLTRRRRCSRRNSYEGTN